MVNISWVNDVKKSEEISTFKKTGYFVIHLGTVHFYLIHIFRPKVPFTYRYRLHKIILLNFIFSHIYIV